MKEVQNPLLEIDKIMERFQDRVPVDFVRIRLRRLQESLKNNCESDWRNFAVDLLGGKRRRLNDDFLNDFFKRFGVESKVQSIRHRQVCISDGLRNDRLLVIGIETTLAGVTLELWQQLKTPQSPHPWVRVTAILDDNAKKAAMYAPSLIALNC